VAAAHAAARTVPDAPARTRERLLRAAEKLFAERGFRATSVRDITSASRCNLASVNYHFGGKLALYREVLKRRMRALRERRIRSMHDALAAAGDRADLEMLLRAFTTAFLEPHLDESQGRVLMQLFSRELLDPLLEANTLQKEMVDPVERSLIEAMRAVGVGLQGRAARRCVQSVVAQLAHAIRMRGMPGAASARTREDFDFSQIVDHIVRFSLAGIGSYAGRGEG
jgi:TetR/AcrR family transcriptional regulator, regulator of cefoperazone and chloramphenicol sensitivity